MFKKILIANRGEIACRIIRTARKMGIQTVAVYSDADRHAQHVELADEAFHIGASQANQSYLAAEKIITACQQSGAQAIHPGYGFLSENAEFARRVEAQGLIFIGPKHEAIKAMGDKITAKNLASKADVNIIPGVNQAIRSVAEATTIAQSIGYPVMIKAANGGGGKGLRIAHHEQQISQAFISCQNEARASFASEDVFIEKLIEAPRHIEIQILADAHGNMVYLGERECSIQRRHQKLIEEAPSPFINAATRQAMGEQALMLARAVNYQSVGTVEFVVAPDQSFYFLEMNTRLQVEHPVTEMVTGLDLVEWMIRIAAGEALTFSQADIQTQGWAIECRINAEDVEKGFLPSIGRLTKWLPPAATQEEMYFTEQSSDQPKAAAPSGECDKINALAPQIAKRSHTPMRISNPAQYKDGNVQPVVQKSVHIRLDTGVIEGDDISMYYDAMMAKLIVHGQDREQAIMRMRSALNAFVIRGVNTNIYFQSMVMMHPRFIAGDFNTHFIAEEFSSDTQRHLCQQTASPLLIAVITAMHRRYLARKATMSGQLTGYKMPIDENFVVLINDVYHHAKAIATDDGYGITVDKSDFFIRSTWQPGEILYFADINAQRCCVQVERVGLDYRVAHNGIKISAKVFTARVAQLHRLMLSKTAQETSKFLLSPMPGLLIELAVKPGQTVKAGGKLATIEAMKMENVLFAPRDVVVETLLAQEGESLAVGQAMIEFQ